MIEHDDVLTESIDKYFYPSLMERIKDSYDIHGFNCAIETFNFLQGLNNDTRAAYFDSFGKVGPGILTGNVIYLGYYDQCIDIGNTDFCRFPFNVSLQSDTYSPGSIVFQIGMCFPSSCNATEFYSLITDTQEGSQEEIIRETFPY